MLVGFIVILSIQNGVAASQIDSKSIQDKF